VATRSRTVGGEPRGTVGSRSRRWLLGPRRDRGPRPRGTPQEATRMSRSRHSSGGGSGPPARPGSRTSRRAGAGSRRIFGQRWGRSRGRERRRAGRARRRGRSNVCDRHHRLLGATARQISVNRINGSIWRRVEEEKPRLSGVFSRFDAFRRTSLSARIVCWARAESVQRSERPRRSPANEGADTTCGRARSCSGRIQNRAGTTANSQRGLEA
jgi:hypothetical protein